MLSASATCGGAFLVPYLVFVVTCGVPLFLLETTIGQYSQEGGVTCWRKLCPLAEGIGFGGQLILLYSCMTYIIILSWALLYLVFSFSSQLPWASCNNYWNTGRTSVMKEQRLRSIKANEATDVVVGTVFSVLGFMAHKQGIPIAEVAESGAYLYIFSHM
ncbi:hypothetical protein XENOCAPTIV_028064 [Xenoophorus captivus]|uniref:Uncharacterized protein n=1 Tax=Xenoophorus captivus TaxID=1517983 RepID=A0ABV0QP84_9TELE